MAQATSSAPAGPGQELTLVRIYNAPRTLVFKVWTDPKHIAQWWGPHAYTNPVCELDPRPGGAILIHMQGPGQPPNPMTGTFREIREPELLVFISEALPDASGEPQLQVLNTVTFEDLNGKTKLTLRVKVLKANAAMAGPLQGMEQGWAETLERLGDFLVNPFDSTPLAARELVFRRMIKAARALVFDAWTDPAKIAHWWGPNGFKTTTYSMDVKPGGVWDFTMHGPDGRDYKNKIVYTAVERPKFLAYQHAGEGADSGVRFHSTVTFGEMFGMTSITLRLLFATAEARDHNVKTYHSLEGGEQTMNRLLQYAENSAPASTAQAPAIKA
jgi:uncharacterized protein YndB with AHSA1/START domain